MKLVTVEQMKEIEKQANQNGLSYEKMMAKAGLGLAHFIQSTYGGEKKVITGLVGSGNNGGDTLVALAALGQAGWQSWAYLVRSRQANDPLIKKLQQCGGLIMEAGKHEDFGELKEWLESSSVLLDGILGTGIRLPLEEDIAKILEFVKGQKTNIHVVAVDCPSGVNSVDGDVAPECIPAEVTICMGAVKTGLLQFPAFNYVGRFEVVDLGFPAKLPIWHEVNQEVATAKIIRSMLPKRSRDSHKGTYGTTLIVAGSTNYTGSALLAAKAACRIGTGLVRLAVPGPVYGALAGHVPEATWLVLPHEMGVIEESAADIIRKNLARVSSILLGPGWGVEETTRIFLRDLLINKVSSSKKARIGFVGENEKGEGEDRKLPPIVIDADGLKLLAQIPNWPSLLPAGSILTPHPGEMSTLCGLPLEQIQKSRIETAEKFAREWRQIVILKGAVTIVAEPGGRVCAIPIATSALASAGTGDVLAGLVVGLRAQGMNSYEAAISGAWIHAEAGLISAETAGHEAAVIASDVIDSIPAVLKLLK